ncbi:hypothetical protein [Geomicrobium sp. JCM 19037]|uniref:hypothetical protein n=1 Tax=Geomicrobium sp. JCM 19037 TaxID=1460634 RepID=UPI0012687FEE|nr:hypothetical protein [Geomicrobium sp. JCM 19037]
MSILGGILLHDLLLLTVVSIVKRKINGKWFKAISIIAGVLLLVFAAYFLLSGVRNIIEL